MTTDDDLARWALWPGPRDEPEREPSEPWARAFDERDSHRRRERLVDRGDDES
jgi:hypothetical protein